MRHLYMACLAGWFLASCAPETPSASVNAVSAPASASAMLPMAFEGSDVRGEALGGDFVLTAHDGRSVKLSDWRGKVVVLVFGFTHCPDACPTHLMTYAQALSQLTPQEAEQVQLLFISADPARDTPDLLSRYVTTFHERFIGLTTADGSEEAVHTAMKLYGASATKLPPREDGFYFVEHSTTTFMLDREGKVAVAAPLGQTATQLAHDLRLLLATPR